MLVRLMLKCEPINGGWGHVGWKFIARNPICTYKSFKALRVFKDIVSNEASKHVTPARSKLTTSAVESQLYLLASPPYISPAGGTTSSDWFIYTNFFS
jgi:hypothetical protein